MIVFSLTRTNVMDGQKANASYIHICLSSSMSATRHRSPESTGVIERVYQSIEYEHLYLHVLDHRTALAEHVATSCQAIYNEQRPHEAINWAQRRGRYNTSPTAACHAP